MKRLLFFTFMSLALVGRAQVVDKPIAGGGSALGLTYIGLTDHWAAIRNTAALGWDSTFWVGVHHQNRYLLAELGLSTVAACIPARPGAFGISLSHTGFSRFNVSRADLSFGMRLGARFTAGVGLAYHHAHVTGDYKNGNAITVSAGVQFAAGKKVMLGMFLFNPARASLEGVQTMPAMLGLALTYTPAPQVLVALQVDADTENKTSLHLGAQYRPIDMLAIRVGYSTNNAEGLTAGLGLAVRRFDFDISVGYHNVLGISPLFSMAYQFNR